MLGTGGAVVGVEEEAPLLFPAPGTGRAGPSPQVMEHAKIVLEYFNSLKNEGQTDVKVYSAEGIVRFGHRLILAAFSQRFKYALRSARRWPNYNLTVFANTGISSMVLGEIVDFCYTGECRFSDELFMAAEFLECATLKTALEKAKSNPSCHVGRLIVDESHAVNFLDALWEMKTDDVFLDCVLEQEYSKSVVRVHRLVLCAYARDLEDELREKAKYHLQVRVPVCDTRVTITDLKLVANFLYSGYMLAARKRLSSTRVAAAALMLPRMVSEINVVIEKETVQHRQRMDQGQFEDGLDVDYGVEASAIGANSSLMAHQQEEVMDDEYDMGGDDGMAERRIESPYGDYYYLSSTPHQQQSQHIQHHSSEVVEASVEEQSGNYEYYVKGPNKGKRGGTYPLRSQQVQVTGQPVLVQESDSETDDIYAVNVTIAPPKRRRLSRRIDEYGFGLPQIHTTSEVTVPLVVGDQQRMMEKPFKCTYEVDCDYRSTEKAAVEKHIRCKHTHEQPYKCPYPDCLQKFSVQSNLARHIRSHRREKPYKCRRPRCDKAYADKKNLTAHEYRDHLKRQQILCVYCPSKFYERVKYLKHCEKIHGQQSMNQMGGSATIGWAYQ